MDIGKEIKTLKYVKWTKYAALLYFFFCIFSLVTNYLSSRICVHNMPFFLFSSITVLLWAINPMVLIVSLMGLKAYFIERKNVEDRNIVRRKWIVILLWNVGAILAWFISLFF